MNVAERYTEDSDREAELIRLLKLYDERAFREVVENYKDRVYNLCLGFLKNEADAEDIAQEVFVEIYNSISSFHEDSALSTWIYRIGVNKSLELLRKTKRKKRFGWITSIFGIEDQVGVKHADFVHPGVALENKERSQILMAHIDKLPDKQKVAFNLHKLEGLSYQEVSQVMELSVSSVESLLFRAKKNLQKSLGIYYKNI
ncbi:RNA polymerase sigma factor [Fulvivirga sp. 2943]|uniref:RNA polymerase sigma factor n=1 Tax=Fulvivirga sediminis TaxID=2803949 RepID=A0A937F7I1_9BACT|nr:RNA polymerase sigma factor [Fulvivirga sediminis]